MLTQKQDTPTTGVPCLLPEYSIVKNACQGCFFKICTSVRYKTAAARYCAAAVLLFLGFLGEYIMSMNARIMNRPLVVEEERINFDENKDKK